MQWAIQASRGAFGAAPRSVCVCGEQEMELHLLTLGALAPAGGNARCAAVDLLLVKWIDHCEEKYEVSLIQYAKKTIASHHRHLSE